MVRFEPKQSFDIGGDTRTGIALLKYRHDVPFKFTGTINKLAFNFGSERFTDHSPSAGCPDAWIHGL